MAAETITADELKQRIDAGEPIQFVDARNPRAWAEAQSKAPGAVRVPMSEAEQHLAEIPKDRPVVTYCT
jgi:rhodanese-related sulfurtransferase